VPAEVEFATKPALAAAMIARAVAAGVPAGWVAGDEVYGADPRLRATIRDLGIGYVLQISANRRVSTAAGRIRVDQLPILLPPWTWQRRSAGPGSKGHRYYSWAWIAILPEDPGDTGQHHVLIRRNDTTGELAYHRCYSPRPVPLATLVKVAGQRWRIEESFQAAKSLTGIDQHQVRRWTSWHRWTTLAMLAHAFLAVATAAEHDHTPHAGRTHRTHRPRVPAPLRRAPAHPQTQPRQAPRLVDLATTTSSPSPRLPLQATREPMITNYGCRTRTVEVVTENGRQDQITRTHTSASKKNARNRPH
jgi:SRSO17 transposase